MKHAVLSTVRRLAGTYRLLEDPLLPEKATQRRIDSFRFFLPPPITVKEETSDVLTSPTEEDTENETAGIKRTLAFTPNLTIDHRRSRKNQYPNQDRHILGLGFRTPGEILSLPQETVWKVEACLQKPPGCMV